MTVQIDLKKIVEAFNHSMTEVAPSIEIKSDYYWAISRQDLFKVESEPSGLSIGQLTDDYQEICDDVAKGRCDKHTLAHLASLLRYLSEQ